MVKNYLVILGLVLIFIVLATFVSQIRPVSQEINVTCSKNPEQSRITLPVPDFEGKILEKTILERRSIREYSEEELSLYELSMILWAGNGITDERGLRSAPSAGGLYPIDMYIVPNRVENASCGLYKYIPGSHEIVLVEEGEFAEQMYQLSYEQEHVRNAAVVVVLVAVPERTTVKYGEEGKGYVFMEAGHIAENMLLEAVSLGLGAVPVGGFEKENMDDLFGLEENEDSIYMVLVGKTIRES